MMKKVIFGIVMAAFMIALVGCGGGLSTAPTGSPDKNVKPGAPPAPPAIPAKS